MKGDKRRLNIAVGEKRVQHGVTVNMQDDAGELQAWKVLSWFSRDGHAKVRQITGSPH
jgi:hypothetical protein